jgi:hypothetical protein
MHDRGAEREELRQIFLSGASCQMLAPRRVGKTWLMHKIEEDFRRTGWLTAFVDVEGMRTEEEFLRALCRKIEEAGTLGDRAISHLKQRLKQLISGDWDGSVIEALGHVDPKEFSEALVASLEAQNKDTLILIDEIALFVMGRLKQDEAGTLSFLYHLRKLRQSYPRVRWFFTGSIGLDVVARRAGLQGAFIGLEVFPLDPFDEPAAWSYFSERCRSGGLRRSFQIEPDVFSYLADEIGWLVPYYLDQVGNQIRPDGARREGGAPRVSREEIDRAIDDLLMPRHRLYFATWEEHIDKNFPDAEAALLHAILETCCEQASGEIAGTILARVWPDHPKITPRFLLDMLTALDGAGFLVEADGRWRFRSGLLRRYWRKYHHI